MIRDEYEMTTWRGWDRRIANAVRLTKASWRVDADLIVMGPAMLRRLGVVIATKCRIPFKPVRALVVDGRTIHVVEEPDMRDGDQLDAA